jgi:DNA-binding MarR family transcriptional regulator
MPDPEDRRAKRVVFTARGKQSMLQGLQHLQSLEPELLAVLGDRKLRSFRGALLLLHDNLLARPEGPD